MLKDELFMSRNQKKLNNEWEELPLHKIANILMGQSPPSNTYNTEGNGLPFYQGNKDFGFKYPNKKVWCSKPVRIAEKGSVLISVRAPVGDVNMTLEKCCIGRGLASINSDNNEFIYYLIKFNREKFKNIFENEGTVFGCLTKEGLRNFKVTISKEKKVKDKIAKILSSLDDKIELNNKMNRTLEKIAQAIFKHWFIDFEFPDENGKPYKSSGGKMVDSEMGKIPEGWKVVMLENVVIRNKKAMRKKEEWENKKIIDLSVMPNFSMIINTFNEGKNFKTNIYELNEYDILFGSIRPYFGKAGFSPIKGAITGTVYSFKPNDDSLFSYILLNITNKNFIDYTIQYSRGTKMPIISWDDIIKYRILMPNNKTLINNFEKLVKPLIVQIKENILQNQTLFQLRDSLLPRLMAGRMVIS